MLPALGPLGRRVDSCAMRRAVALEPHSAFNQKALALLLYKSHKLPESIGAFQVRACVPMRLPHVAATAAVDWGPSGVRTY